MEKTMSVETVSFTSLQPETITWDTCLRLFAWRAPVFYAKSSWGTGSFDARILDGL